MTEYQRPDRWIPSLLAHAIAIPPPIKFKKLTLKKTLFVSIIDAGRGVPWPEMFPARFFEEASMKVMEWFAVTAALVALVFVVLIKIQSVNLKKDLAKQIKDVARLSKELTSKISGIDGLIGKLRS
jgi:hypothetical protein